MNRAVAVALAAIIAVSMTTLIAAITNPAASLAAFLALIAATTTLAEHGDDSP